MRRIEEKRRLIIREMEAGQGSDEIMDHPMSLEPPFSPFDLRRESESFLKSIFQRKGKEDTNLFTQDGTSFHWRFIRLKASRDDKNSLESAEAFILSLPSSGVKSFEIIGHMGKIFFQISVPDNQAEGVVSQARSHFPKADIFTQQEDLMRQFWPSNPVSRTYRLKASHFFRLSPIADNAMDSLRSLLAVFSDLRAGQTGALQVLFATLGQNWQDNIRRASRSPFNPSESPFVDLPTLPKMADLKLAKPLYAVGIRMLASDNTLLSSIEQFFRQYESGENGIVAVAGNYPAESILQRNTHVYGAILNLSELSLFLHLPSPDLLDAIPTIDRAENTNPVPDEHTVSGPILGTNMHRGTRRIVRHGNHLPNRHVYSVGKSGYGKSNLILVSALQRIQAGEGVGVVDPHGSLIREGILPRIPRERINDVIYFNAGDFEYPMAINPLAHSGTKLEKEHIRADLLNFFEDLFATPLGVNIQHALNFFIITLLSYQDSTLFDLERLLIDKDWRLSILQRVADDRIRTFWEREFPLLEKRSIITAITNKLSPLILPDSTIASMLKSRENKIDFLRMMNERKIALFNLSHGDIGKRNSQLLGKLLVSKLQIAAMMREGDGGSPDFYLYIDEFQHMACPSMADILSGARKYNLHLWLANQMIGDIPDHVLRHVFNASTLIFFATDSPSDQSLIERNLSRRFKAEDIGRLNKGETFVKMVNSVFNMATERVAEPPSQNFVSEIITASRAKYTGAQESLKSGTGVRTETNEGTGQKLQKPLKKTESSISHTNENSANPVLPLSESEELFLRGVFENPALSVTNLYKKLKLSAYKGDKIKTALRDKSLIQEMTTHLGAGSRIAKFLLLTARGFAALGTDHNLGSGKGGVLHRYWQSVIQFHAEGLGYRATIEESIGENKEAADLGLSKDGKRFALEISVTTRIEQEIANTRKCIEAGYDKAVVLFLDERKLAEFRDSVEKVLNPEVRLRASAGLVYDFCRFL